MTESRTIVPNSEELSKKVDVQLLEFVEEISIAEHNLLTKLLGEEAYSQLSENRPILKENDQDIEHYQQMTYVVPVDKRVVTLTHMPVFNMVDIAFEMEEDYLQRKTGTMNCQVPHL